MTNFERIIIAIIDRTPITFFESRIAILPYRIARLIMPNSIITRELRDAIIENSDHLDDH